MSEARLANSGSFASLELRLSKLNARSNVRWRWAFATLLPSMPAHELAVRHGWRIRFAGSGRRLQVCKSDVRNPDKINLRTFGLSDQWFDGNELSSADNEGKARKRRAPATHKMAGDCEGVSRAPGSKDQSGSFRASATSATQLARVARVSRENGHTAIAGGRCLDAGFMRPPRSLSIAR